MVKRRFYGGVNEIGSSRILLEDKKTRILFDFGQSFTFGTSARFTSWLAPRTANGRDYFAFNRARYFILSHYSNYAVRSLHSN